MNRISYAGIFAANPDSGVRKIMVNEWLTSERERNGANVAMEENGDGEEC